MEVASLGSVDGVETLVTVYADDERAAQVESYRREGLVASLTAFISAEARASGSAEAAHRRLLQAYVAKLCSDANPIDMSGRLDVDGAGTLFWNVMRVNG